MESPNRPGMSGDSAGARFEQTFEFNMYVDVCRSLRFVVRQYHPANIGYMSTTVRHIGLCMEDFPVDLRSRARVL